MKKVILILILLDILLFALFNFYYNIQVSKKESEKVKIDTMLILEILDNQQLECFNRVNSFSDSLQKEIKLNNEQIKSNNEEIKKLKQKIKEIRRRQKFRCTLTKVEPNVIPSK